MNTIIRDAILQNFIMSNDDDIENVLISYKELKAPIPEDMQKEFDVELDRMVFEKLLSRNFHTPDFEIYPNPDLHYSLTEFGIKAVRHLLNLAPKSERTTKITKVIDELIQKSNLPPERIMAYSNTLNEINKCYDVGCYNATIGLCGKIIEIYLRDVLDHFNIPILKYQYNKKESKSVPTDDLTLGDLLSLTKDIKDHGKIAYIDPNVITLIKSYRNGAVHFSEKIPVPSDEQTQGIILITTDLIKRRLSYDW